MSRVLFVSKTTDWCRKAADKCREAIGAEVLVVQGCLGDPLPGVVEEWSGDVLISFLSPWILPAAVLSRAKVMALNFHPGPPEYPGIGCYNFALYDRAERYGVTAHVMAPAVDTGKILKVSYFSVDSGETVFSLKEKSMREMFELFCSVTADIAAGCRFQGSGEVWTRRPYTRRELNDLCRIDPSMDQAEVSRRVKATTFPGAPGAWVELYGYRFEYVQK